LPPRDSIVNERVKVSRVFFLGIAHVLLSRFLFHTCTYTTYAIKKVVIYTMINICATGYKQRRLNSGKQVVGFT
jgi:hypothetical protein